MFGAGPLGREVFYARIIEAMKTARAGKNILPALCIYSMILFSIRFPLSANERP